MQFSVSPAVFHSFPDLAVGIVVARGIDNTGVFPDISKMLRAAEATIRSSFDLETYREHPHIAAVRRAHESFGSNPNKFPPSIQALIKRILKGGELPAINPVVDLYNILSLRYVVCAGAEDTDQCRGDIILDYADGTEHFQLLGGQEEEPPQKGELVYKDEAGVICRKLNWRECDRTQMSETTKNAVIVLEGFPPFSQFALGEALHACAELLQKYCGGQQREVILTREQTACSCEVG